MSYRASSQTSTKHSPFFMLYQQDMRLPIDVELMRNGVDREGVDSEGEEDLDKVMDILLEKRKEVFEKVEKNIKRAQQYQKETYDRKHLPRELDLGMEVLIENSAQKERKGGKLEDAFLGPYIIHESLGKGLYKVKNKSGVILKKKVNIARLKMYKERDDSKVKPLKAIFSLTPQPSDQQPPQLSNQLPPEQSNNGTPQHPLPEGDRNLSTSSKQTSGKSLPTTKVKKRCMR